MLPKKILILLLQFIDGSGQICVSQILFASDVISRVSQEKITYLETFSFPPQQTISDVLPDFHISLTNGFWNQWGALQVSPMADICSVTF